MGNDSSSTSLTQQDLEYVQYTWKIVMQNPQENGITIFKTFLETYNYYPFFKKFEGIPKDELENNQLFRNHALKIMLALDGVTACLGNEEALRNKLNALGRMHARNHVTEQQFEELKWIILDILRTAFGLPDEGIESWRKTLDYAFVYIFEGLRA